MSTNLDDKISQVLALASLPLPAEPKIVEIRHQPYVDWLGEESLQIWVILEEGTPEDQPSGRTGTAITGTIHDALLNAGIDLFPYVHFATCSELREIGMEP